MRLPGRLGKSHLAKSIPDHSVVDGKHGRHAELSHQRTAGLGDQTLQMPLATGKRSGMECTVDHQDLHVRSQLSKERPHLVEPETCLDQRKQLRADVA